MSEGLVGGLHAVRELLRASPERVRRLVLREGRLDARVRELLHLARRHGIPVYREPRRVVDRLAPAGHHQGVVAEVSPTRWWSLDELLAELAAPALLVALDEVEDPRNLGAVARSVEAVGGDGIVLPARRSAPPSAAALQSSAGALALVRLVRVTNLADAIGRLREHGVRAVGLAPGGERPYFALNYTGPVLFVAGSEGRGLRPRVARACDELVHLPCRGRVASLNVSVAVGVALYEALRQRLEGGGAVAGKDGR